MGFSDVEMSILSQLAYRDIDYKPAAEEPLASLLSNNKDWLQEQLGSSYEGHIDNLINKVQGSGYTLVASEHDKISGFAAYAISTPNNEVIVACRGTEPTHINDLLTDAGLGLAPETQQHRDMEKFVNRLEKKGYDGYYFTGHSLGGNVAIHGATTVDDPNKVKGVCAFNAPGFNEAYWILNGWKLNQINNITCYQNEYDYISSILRTPGRTRVIESSLDGNHAGIDDHSINAYKIDENGDFQDNATGKKHPQTYAGTAIGEAGNSFVRYYTPLLLVMNRIFGANKGTVYVHRDFSEASKQKMLGLVTQVENEKWGDFTDWIGDRWYDFESWIGTLNIRNYINDVNTYHKKVIDKNNATEQTITKIFETVWAVDSSYAINLGDVKTQLEQWLRFVDTMAGIVEPGKGRFNGKYMANALNPILQDVSEANIQQIKNSLLKNIEGEPVLDEDLLLEYIKKDPAQMTYEEKKAVLDVIQELHDNVAFYESAAVLGDEQFGAAFWNRAAWVSETNKFASFSAVSAHYNQLYVDLLDACIEMGADSNTFAAALLEVGNGENALSVLGVELSEDVSKIFGSSSAAAYLAKWKTEHSESYFGKLEISESEKFGAKNGIDGFNKWAKDKLIENDHYIEEKDEFYLDEDGNEIKKTKDTPTFYDKELTLGEVSEEVSASVSIYDGSFDVGENGKIDVTVGEAEAHASVSAGFYVIGADGEKKFSPGVNAEVGASVTAFEAEWEQQWLGDENLGLNTDVGVTVGKAEAKADVGAQFFSEDGKLDVQLGASASAEAIAAEAEASVGVNILGGEVGVTGGVNFGIGAHADVGYRDGVFKCDVGASLGVGVSLDVEIDIGGMVDGVCDAAEAAGDFVSDKWNDFQDGWNNFWNW